MSGDKGVQLLISKIYNWPASQGTPHLELTFLPLHTHPPLLTTTVPTRLTPNCLLIQQLLKVTYPPHQHQLQLLILHAQNNSKVGEVTIDMEALKQQGTQYLPLPRSNQVLKIAIGTESKAVTPRSVISKQNTHFIEEKEDFLRRIKDSTSETSNQATSRQRSNFASRVYGLLQEAKSLRNNMKEYNTRRTLPSQQELKIESDPRISQPAPFQEEGQPLSTTGIRLNIRNLEVVGSPSHHSSGGEPLLKMSFGKDLQPS